MNPRKQRLLNALPLRDAELTVRPCTRQDLDTLSRWPQYPWPYEPFQLSFANQQPARLDEVFQQRVSDPGRITLVVDEATCACIAYVALLHVDWEQGVAGDMSFRVAPDHCGRGIGTKVMCLVGQWFLHSGMRALRLNVAAANTRAIRCYEKAGFQRQEGFWRPDPKLPESVVSEPRYEFLRPHTRVVGGVVQLRFWWMQLQAIEP